MWIFLFPLPHLLPWHVWKDAREKCSWMYEFTGKYMLKRFFSLNQKGGPPTLPSQSSMAKKQTAKLLRSFPTRTWSMSNSKTSESTFKLSWVRSGFPPQGHCFPPVSKWCRWRWSPAVLASYQGCLRNCKSNQYCRGFLGLILKVAAGKDAATWVNSEEIKGHTYGRDSKNDSGYSSGAVIE